jgi:uncharacterized protein YukE
MTTEDWYAVNWEDQREAAAFVQKAMGACSKEIESVTTETNGMLEAWKDGPTKDNFSQRQKTFLNAANEIVLILDRFRASLETSADIAQAAELDNAKRMQPG